MGDTSSTHFQAFIKNSTGGVINLYSLYNGVESPPVDSGNPSYVLECIPANGKTSTVIQASGGYHVDTSGYSSNPHHVTTKGEATYIMPTGHTIVIHWKVVWGQSPEVTMGGTYPRIPAPTKEETSTNHWHYTWELS